MKLEVVFTTLLLLAVSALPVLAIEPEPGPIRDTWARTDQPVLEGMVNRTWMWGPEAVSDLTVEPYQEAPGSVRIVQYFHKSRMEITDPAADQESPWYVANGLLVVEMVTGRIQLGHAAFENRSPAPVNVAGDSDDPEGPTYATFNTLLDTPPLPFDVPITQTVDRAGGIGSAPELAVEDVQVAVIDEVTSHTIPGPFWDFMISSGTVYEDGTYLTDELFENPYFATGRPISEPYWAEVEVGGTDKWVLIQAFERRILTYTPDNPAGWQVEAGNVGQHYFTWRYGNVAPEPPPSAPGRTITIEINGLEINAGETAGDTTYGLRFVGLASGDVDGAMDVSLDYSPANPGPNVVNMIVSGRWSITGVSGSLNGAIAGGSATWDGSVSEASIDGTFVITGATGEFAGYTGTGRYTGVLSHRFFPPRIGGTLAFDLE